MIVKAYLGIGNDTIYFDVEINDEELKGMLPGEKEDFIEDYVYGEIEVRKRYGWDESVLD